MLRCNLIINILKRNRDFKIHEPNIHILKSNQGYDIITPQCLKHIETF